MLEYLWLEKQARKNLNWRRNSIISHSIAALRGKIMLDGFMISYADQSTKTRSCMGKTDISFYAVVRYEISVTSY